MKILSSILIFASIIVSCDNNRIYEQYDSIPGEKWHIDSLKDFNFQIEDSLAIYNVIVNIRNLGNYQFSNLILFVGTDMPGDKSIRDTLNCVLSDEKGKWLGSGFGSIWTSSVPYKVNVRFPRRGLYSIDIQHGMRAEALQGISDIGVRIEKVN